MKNYPFSKKALKAMLAATVAFSPLVSTGIIVKPNIVSAAETQYPQLDGYLNTLYLNLRGYEKSELATSFNQLKNNDTTIESILATLPASSNYSKEEAKVVLKGLFELYYGKLIDSNKNLGDDIAAFKAANQVTLDKLFNNKGNEAIDLYFEFLQHYHVTLSNSLNPSNLTVEEVLNNYTSATALSNYVLQKSKTTWEQSKLNSLNSYFGNLGLDADKLINIKDTYLEGVSNYQSIKLILSSAASRGKEVNISINNVILQNQDNFVLTTGDVKSVSIISNSELGVFLNGLHFSGLESSNAGVVRIANNQITAVGTGEAFVSLKMGDQVLLREKVVVNAAASNPGNGNTTPTPGPVTPPVVTPPTQGDHVITLPQGAAEVVKEKNTSGKVEVVTKVDPKKVSDIVNLITADKNTVAIKLEKPAEGETVKAQVPATLFTEALKKNKNAVVEVSAEGASYKLPASELKVADLAAKLGVAEGAVQINVSVNVVSATDVKETVNKNKLNLASDVIDFTVEAVSGEKKETISKFSVYVERSIVGAKDFNANHSVAVRLNDDGSITPIPTVFEGKVATVKSLTNSKYTIVENNKTFSDVSTSSWAKSFIDTLASKYIVNGKTTDTFDPSANMTRAEFAVLLVRALGLSTEQYDGGFKDVNGNEWFAKSGELTAAVKAGLVKGVTEETFAPGAKITRAQAAVMIQRAMEIDFLNYDQSQLNQTKSLADFKDSDKVGTWAKDGVEAVYQAGLVDGKDGSFDPNGYTQRQEMAKILANFLVSAGLMNKIN